MSYRIFSVKKYNEYVHVYWLYILLQCQSLWGGSMLLGMINTWLFHNNKKGCFSQSLDSSYIFSYEKRLYLNRSRIYRDIIN